MEELALSFLSGWESFYVIIGTSAAVLIGLQFVVVTLAAQMNRGASESSRAFATPTIVHFCSVLLISSIVTAPWPTHAGVTLSLSLCGIAGLIYMAIVLRIALRQHDYEPVLEDWIWHFTLPPIAYAMLLIAAAIFQSNPTTSLFIVAGSTLLLLFIGIHNAWDAATYIALSQQQKEEREE